MTQVPLNFKFAHKSNTGNGYTACKASFAHYAVMWIDEETQELVAVLYTTKEVLENINNGMWIITKLIR